MEPTCLSASVFCGIIAVLSILLIGSNAIWAFFFVRQGQALQNATKPLTAAALTAPPTTQPPRSMYVPAPGEKIVPVSPNQTATGSADR
uniref:Nematode cuticle collagen N-terminal domain-containing protein n=1 Tax=Panagrellus redivivus TaxID=6233 RepID=A0A7E4W753_PANRE